MGNKSSRYSNVTMAAELGAQDHGGLVRLSETKDPQLESGIQVRKNYLKKTGQPKLQQKCSNVDWVT